MLISLGALLGLAVAIVRIGRAPLQIGPLSAIAAVILILYAAVILNFLPLATTCLIIIGVVALISEIVIFRSKTILLDPRIFSYAIAAIALWLWLRNASFFSWDDFSHWGLRTKDVVSSGGLESIISLKEYPPGANLFHYFCLWPVGMSEGGVFVANAWILVAPLTMVVQRQGRLYAYISAVIASAVLYLCYRELGVGFTSAQVDSLLTGMFAGVVLSYYIADENQAGAVWILLPLAALPLIKDSGYVFALVAAVAISVDVLFLRSQSPLSARVGFVAALVLIPVAIGKSWQLHVSSQGYHKTFPVETLSFSNVARELLYQETDTTRTVIHNFVEALVRKNIGLGMPVIGWLALALIMSAAIVARPPKAVTRPRLVSLFSLLALGLLLYAAGLLVLYMMFFKFGGENVALASFQRYMGTYLSAFFIVGIFLALPSLSRLPLSLAAIPALIVLIPVFVRALTISHPQDEFRVANQSRLIAINAAVAPGATIQIISQGSKGDDIVRVRYELSPRKYRGEWTVGAPYWDNDPYTKKLTVEQFRAGLSGVDYLFLVKVDENFWSHYASLFDEKDQRSEHYLYRVSKRDGLTLTPIL